MGPPGIGAPFRVYIGWDPREMEAWNVAQRSLKATTGVPVKVHRLGMLEMSGKGLYKRPTELRNERLWDVISEAPMSTGHAIARFLVPYLSDYRGWALFTDGDVLFRRTLENLFALANPAYAVQVVQHVYAPRNDVKMGGQVQTRYARKNWSSVVLWNCGHPSNQKLTVDLVNTLPGRDLHAFCWLQDAEIGALPASWNWLVGHSDPALSPAIVHFTEGSPEMPGYEHCAYADEWYDAAKSCGYALNRPPKPEEQVA